jgi:SAM-dependent methyltransferase
MRAQGLDTRLGLTQELDLPSGGFDVVSAIEVLEHVPDPDALIAEAARLLRPGGELIFLVNGVIAVLTFPDDPNAPAGETLLRPYFGMHRFEWPGEDSVDFHIPHGEMIALLRRCGFVVEELIEVRPPEGSTTSFPLVTLEWARQWPCEEIWKARKPS